MCVTLNGDVIGDFPLATKVSGKRLGILGLVALVRRSLGVALVFKWKCVITIDLRVHDCLTAIWRP